jgi:hypothetical protein
MAKKPSTGADDSGARQDLRCSGKNRPANKSVANFSQGRSAKNFDARQRRPSAAGMPRSHHSRDLMPSDDVGRRRTSGPLLITLDARGCGRFDVLFNGKRIVQAGSQPICEAARILHRLGHDDDVLLVARHQGANHDAIHGPLGVWRRLRIREGRGGPRYAKWEPFPSRPVAVMKSRPRGRATGHRTVEKDTPTAAPGAGKGHSQAPAPSTIGLFDPEVSDA